MSEHVMAAESQNLICPVVTGLALSVTDAVSITTLPSGRGVFGPARDTATALDFTMTLNESGALR